MTPEQSARVVIDKKLTASGWDVQDMKDFNPAAVTGVAVREFRTDTDGRFRRFTFEQIKERDKTSLDIFWIKDISLADLDNLPDPDVFGG